MNTQVIKYVPDTLRAAVLKARSQNNFVVNQPYTNKKLINDITDKLNISLNSKIAVLFTVEWALEFRLRGYSDVTVITEKHDPLIQRMSDLTWFKYMTLDQAKNMRFDNIVSNPPFSDAGLKKTNAGNTKSLYDKFYKKSVELADSVCMIMPDTSNQQRPAHNKFLKSTAHSMVKIENGVMDVATNMVYVCYNKKIPANISHLFTKFDIGNSIPFQKGKGGNAIPGAKNKFIRAVLQNGVDIQTTGLDKESAKITKNNVVFFSLRLNDSGFNVDVLNNAKRMIAGANVYYIECDSAAEANKYAAMIRSPKFFEPLLSKRGNSNTITLAVLKNAKC